MAEGNSNGQVKKSRSFKDIVNQRVINSQSAEIIRLNQQVEGLHKQLHELTREIEDTNRKWRESEKALLSESELWRELFEDMRQKRDKLRQELVEAELSGLFPWK